ncbi:hypothetical protein Patl1_08818 [Pistacia atlantica]|uniref:Uncharacterized protein n=1 Tax=Pistacia atlantica TaxID=434234 RepID=A0ACC1AI17_9ROSI|nr:hypothetical protein Patl1_08818 [Pistacia atlantica]
MLLSMMPPFISISFCFQFHTVYMKIGQPYYNPYDTTIDCSYVGDSPLVNSISIYKCCSGHPFRDAALVLTLLVPVFSA